jgi:indolepyruvate ferredoxin oxidoreductase alpha subunit
MATRELLLGDEAVALAALHSGISGAYSYPGTPATEIFEFVEARAQAAGVHAFWSANEKVAYEEALGMSFAGKRALVSMKHVGLNVAADPFMNSASTGIHGGMVLCVADDPSMHSSQNEQDTRYYAHFALLPCLEPCNQQEAYDMTRRAFDLSEELKLPVVVRLVTRLAHSRADVEAGTARPQNPLNRARDVDRWTLLPTNARVAYQTLIDLQPRIRSLAEQDPGNRLDLTAPDRHRGIVTSGIAFNYLREAFGGTVPFPFLRLAMYPIPVEKVRQLAAAVDEVVVVEEGFPYIEERLRGLTGAAGKTVRGKLDGFLPRVGELDPTLVARAFGRPFAVPCSPTLEPVPKRPPALCPGCPHADTFAALKEALSGIADPTVMSDIGCYTLSFYPPYRAVESCVDMGASISMAAGAAAAGLHPVLCSIGDSTFTHSGMTPLLTAAVQNLDMTVFILDNGTVAMTGTQKTLATGEALERIVAGLGVPREHIVVITPLPKHRAENAEMIRREIAYPGLSVIISRRPCIQLRKR